MHEDCLMWSLDIVTITPVPYHVITRAVQYVGSNATEVMEYIDSLFAPEVCTIDGNSILCTVGEMHPSDWFVHQFGSGMFVLGGNMVTLDSSPAIVSDNMFSPQMLLAQESIAVGIGPVPELVSLAQATVHVTLKPGFPDTNYQATALLTGAVDLLTALSVTSVSITDADTVAVVVRNTGPVSLSGASILVSAVHNN